jgi:hypothetical protein
VQPAGISPPRAEDKDREAGEVELEMQGALFAPEHVKTVRGAHPAIDNEQLTNNDQQLTINN